ncbi:MAG TPA: CinA family protein [Streptosporangiaceae bacterium]|nr:CinA family protein [Streptosporangiaceae bacterium]
MTAPGHRIEALAATAIELLIARDETVATAESLTGGLVAAALTTVPGSSAVVRGGVVAYATELKAALLGVPSDLLERHGAVHGAVAEAMAEGARDRLGASTGVATTGVAGPDPAEGKPVGMVFVAVAGPGGLASRQLALTGGREEIRAATVASVLGLLISALQEHVV